MAFRVYLGSVLVWMTAVGTSFAHPLDNPKDHNRTIIVHLTGDAQTREVAVRVEYQLDVDENTAIRDDLPAVKKKLDLSDFRNQPDKFYREFVRLYAPVLAANLDSKVDGQTLRFTPLEYRHRLK